MQQILKNNRFIDGAVCAKQFGVDQIKLMDDWHVKCHSATATDVHRVNEYGGGLKLKANFQKEVGYVYLRQFIFDLMEYSGKELELSVDFWCDSPVGIDVYINARPNNDVGCRVLVCDTSTINYPKGRNVHKLKIKMPDLYGIDGFLDCLAKDNMIEFAFRFTGINCSVNVTVNKAELMASEQPD